MPEQLSFDAMAPPEPTKPLKPTDKLFFAALPNNEVKQDIAQLFQMLRTEHSLKNNPVDPRKLHASLFSLGEFAGVPNSRVAEVNHNLANLKVRQFVIRLDRVSSFSGSPSNIPVVIRSTERETGFHGLLTSLLDAMHLKITHSAAKNFSPHITFFYSPKRLPEADVEPIEWLVNEFVLLRSHMGKGLPYDILGRWALHS